MTICTGHVSMVCTMSEIGSVACAEAWLHRCANTLRRLLPVRKHLMMLSLSICDVDDDDDSSILLSAAAAPVCIHDASHV